MTDCGSIHGSTCSSDLNSRDCAHSSRIRIVKLVRPHASSRSNIIGHATYSSFGFSIRGGEEMWFLHFCDVILSLNFAGREYGTGCFVSHVAHGSEAHRRGLRVSI